MDRKIKYAGVAGILSIVISIPLILMEIIRESSNLNNGLTSIYFLADLASAALFLLFIYGFKLVAEKYQNKILHTSSYILMIVSLLYFGYTFITLFFPNLESEMGYIVSIIILGAASIPFGIGLLRLKSHFGFLSTSAGILDIITGISLLTVALSIIGVVLSIPLYVSAALILFRAAKKPATLRL